MKVLDPLAILKHDWNVLCPLIEARQFVAYCKDRGLRLDRSRLENLEKLRLFFPLLRVRRPKIKLKIKYVDGGKRYEDLGVLPEGEDWDGDVRDDYSDFWFSKDVVSEYRNHELIWAPADRAFESWDTFRDREYGTDVTYSYYSIFQLYDLWQLEKELTLSVRLDGWDMSSGKTAGAITNHAEMILKGLRSRQRAEPEIAVLCQALSNRYYPYTQSDRRTVTMSISSAHHGWDWDEYQMAWDPRSEAGLLGIEPDQLKKWVERLQMAARQVDPLRDWYELISFVAVQKKRKLRGDAQMALSLYAMEEILRLFYRDLTGDSLSPPDESASWKKDNYYGEGVTADELSYLEFLSNQYHLNPRPKLILVVEGVGEEEQVPRIVEYLYGTTLSKRGIRLQNLNGIGNFTGRKKADRLGALARYIDDYHDRQTIVFVAIDKEGRAEVVRNKLIEAKSQYHPVRKITKSEYVRLWEPCIEIENFSASEIAAGLSELSQGHEEFSEKDVVAALSKSRNFSSISNLYKRRVNRDIDKPTFLSILVNRGILERPPSDAENGELSRPLLVVLDKVVQLAARNHQPSTRELWEINQKSGYLGQVMDRDAAAGEQ